MATDANGWMDWTIHDPGPPNRVNGGTNGLKGVVIHSAEGFWPALRRVLFGDRGSSWHFSNLKDGRCYQHYSVYSQTWCSGAAYPNNNFPAWENEGIEGQPFTYQQNDNNVRLISEIRELGKWKETRRPTSDTDKAAQLWEHREMVRFNAESTACPSDRVPWDLYLDRLESDEMKIAGWWIGKVFGVGNWEINLKQDFGPAVGYQLCVALNPGTGVCEFKHGDNRIAGLVNARDGASTFVINPDASGKAKFNVLSQSVTFQYIAGTPIK